MSNTFGFRCADGRLHGTEVEANDCLHHPEDKDFKSFAQLPKRPYVRKKGVARQQEPEDEDDSHDDQPLVPASPTLSRSSRGTTTSSQSRQATPVSEPDTAAYATPQTQEIQKHSQASNISPPPAPGGSRFGSRNPSLGPRSPSPTPSGTMDSNAVLRGTIRNLGGGSRGIPLYELRRRQATVSEGDDDSIVPASNRASPAPTVMVPETPLHIYPSIETDNQTPAVEELEAQLTALRQTRNLLASDLADATSLIVRLRQRWQLSQIENKIQVRETEKAVAAGVTARVDAITARAEAERWNAARGKAWAIAGLVLAGNAMYGVWCWYNRVEYEYIRQRQREVFGMA